MALAQGISFDRDKERFIGLLGRRKKIVFLDKHGSGDETLIEGQERGQGAGWRLVRRSWCGLADLISGAHACTERARF